MPSERAEDGWHFSRKVKAQVISLAKDGLGLSFANQTNSVLLSPFQEEIIVTKDRA